MSYARGPIRPGAYQTQKSWLDHLEELKAARDEFRMYAGIMTQYEQSVIQRDIDARRAQAQPIIEAGILGEFQAAVAGYQAAQANLKQAKLAEARRFDTIKLKGEIEAVKALVDLALSSTSPAFGFGHGVSKADHLKAIYQEAQESGDLLKRRAAAEVLRGINPEGMTPEVRMEINHLTHQAERDLNSLRTTEGMTQAEAARLAAQDKVAESVEGVKITHAILDGGSIDNLFVTGPLVKAYRRVKVIDGELTVLAEDDPQVTGVEIRMNEKED
jgi:parvulin-like peptidyl-prolyl isomerase